MTANLANGASKTGEIASCNTIGVDNLRVFHAPVLGALLRIITR